MSDFLYLYGFVPPATPAPTDLTGIAGSPIELLSSGDVKAVVGRVPAQDYAPDRIEDRLQDLKWVAEQGVAHERVVAWFVDHAQILPAPLFTMCGIAHSVSTLLTLVGMPNAPTTAG